MPTAEVLKTVNGWAQAWSMKDADAYLGYYAKDFKTPGGRRATPGKRAAAPASRRPNRFPWHRVGQRDHAQS